MKRFVACGLGLMLVIALGCGRRPAEETTERMIERAIEKEQGGKADVDISGGRVTIKSDQGQFQVDTGGNVSLPKDFPSDVYVYEGAKIVVAASEGANLSVTLQIKASFDKVAQEYKAKMEAAGWEQEASMALGEVTSFTYKKEQRSASVMVNRLEEGDCQVVLTVHNAE